jgi:hypothetical protein
MNPPLRQERDRLALLEGILDGTIDCLVSDHAPHTEEEKSVGMEKAPFGVIGLETLLSAAYTLFVVEKKPYVKNWLALLTTNPSRILGIDRGRIAEGKVLSAAESMVQAGADELNLADTTGMGQPLQVRSLVRLVKKNLPRVKISLHLHDTRGLGLANMFVAYEEGVNIFDVCAGGLGGCPFIEGAAGNVPTEDAAHMFAALGVETGLDLQKMVEVVAELEKILGRPLPGKMARVLKVNADE